jgi:hypothetical protein
MISVPEIMPYFENSPCKKNNFTPCKISKLLK